MAKKNIYRGSYSPNNYLESGNPMVYGGSIKKYFDGGLTDDNSPTDDNSHSIPINNIQSKNEQQSSAFNRIAGRNATNWDVRGKLLESFNRQSNNLKDKKKLSDEDKQDILDIAELKKQLAGIKPDVKSFNADPQGYNTKLLFTLPLLNPKYTKFLNESYKNNDLEPAGFVRQPTIEDLNVESPAVDQIPIDNDVTNAAMGGNVSNNPLTHLFDSDNSNTGTKSKGLDFSQLDPNDFKSKSKTTNLVDSPIDNLSSNTMIAAKGGTIHINPANKGKFNALKDRTGKSTEELTHSKNPLTKKRAIFAQNASHWKHGDGGDLTEYNGPSHVNGGITLGGNEPFAEVEGNETATTGQDKYVFPDKGFKTPGGKTIYVPGTKRTFAQQSKVYNNQLKLRSWDHITKDYVDSKLNELQQTHQEIKDTLDQNALARFEKKNPGLVEKVADQLAQQKLQQVAQSQQQNQQNSQQDPNQSQQVQSQDQVAGYGGNIYKWKNNYNRPTGTYAHGGNLPEYSLGSFFHKIGSGIKNIGSGITDVVGNIPVVGNILEGVGNSLGLGSNVDLKNQINSTQAEQLANNGQYNVNASSINAPNTINAEQANYNGYTAQGYNAKGYNASTYNPTQMDSSILKNAPGYVGNIDYKGVQAKQFVKSDNSQALQDLNDSRSRSVKLAMQSDNGNPMVNAMMADAMASKNVAGATQDFQNQQSGAKNAYNQYATSVEQANAQNQMNVQAQNLNRQQSFNDSRLNTALDINKTNTGYANQAGQFNATSQNQANQFSAEAQNQAGQFNVGAQNQANQYNAGMNYQAAANNAQLRQSTNQFNTNMQYQTNAQNTAYQNQANMYNAQNKLGIDEYNIGEKDAVTAMKLGYANQSNNARIQANQANAQSMINAAGTIAKFAAMGGKLNKSNRYNFNYKTK